MTRRRPRLPLLLLAPAVGLATAVLGVACGGEDGVTPSCPEPPLYNVREPDVLDDDDIEEARRAAIEAGCMTALGEAAAPQGQGGAP